jgi:hypothetical protein
MQESVSLRTYVRRKCMTHDCPTYLRIRNLQQKAERGKNAGSNSCTRFLRLASRKHVIYARYMGAHVRRGTRRPKGMRKRDEKSDSQAAEKGAKKLVSRDYVKILDKEISN